ncbi:MAG: ABC transporter permease [Candidatus Heimdallarchaeota archaeon]|nr:ABC transporter permease [Candidatus Heimdallarchaeota archaeon]
MLLELSFRYFIYNHLRTIKGVKIIALGIVIISSTGILVNSFSTEVTEITQILGSANDTIIISPHEQDYFSTEQMTQLLSLIENKATVLYYFEEYFSIANITVNNQIYQVPIHITDINKFAEYIRYTGAFDPVLQTSFVTEDLYLDLDLAIGGIYELTNEGGSYAITVAKKLDQDLKFINSGIYVNKTQSMTKTNLLYVQFTNERQDEDIVNSINDLDFVKVLDSRPEGRFLVISADQIILLLLILQSLISFLVILNIWNLFHQLLYESKFDIRIMLSIGYERRDVQILFFLMAGIMGFVAFMLSTIISYLLVSIFLTIFTLSFEISYLQVGLDGRILLFNFFNGVIISMLGSFYPIYREVEL